MQGMWRFVASAGPWPWPWPRCDKLGVFILTVCAILGHVEEINAAFVVQLVRHFELFRFVEYEVSRGGDSLLQVERCNVLWSVKTCI